MVSILIQTIVMLAGFFVGFSAFILAVVLVHEAGHIVAGLLCGFRIIAVKVGPVQLQLPNSWDWSFRHMSYLNGYVRAQLCAVPGPWARWRCFGFLFGGFLANVTVALLALPFSHGQTQMANILGYFILISGMVGFAQLIPFEVLGSRSDGSKLWSLLFNRTEREVILFKLSFRARIEEVKMLSRAEQLQEALAKTEEMIALCESNPVLKADRPLMECHSQLRELLQGHLVGTTDAAPDTETIPGYPANAFLTNSLTVRPSARRLAACSLACTAFITWPISLGVGAFPLAAATSATASTTSACKAESSRALGKNSSMTAISAASFAASSGRPPLVN